MHQNTANTGNYFKAINELAICLCVYVTLITDLSKLHTRSQLAAMIHHRKNCQYINYSTALAMHTENTAPGYLSSNVEFHLN